MTAPVALALPRRESFLRGLRRRIALTGASLVYVVLAPFAVLLLSVMTTALGVAVVGVGLLALLLFVPLTQALATVHRRLSGHLLGVEIEEPYQRSTSGSPRKVLTTWANDPARWRDFLWTWVAATIGWALAWVGVALAMGVIFYAIFPFLFAVTPSGVFENNYGVIRIDTQAKAFVEWVWLPIVFGLWWWLEPVIVRGRAQLDRAMLAPSRAALERRVAEVSASRAASVDHSAAELRRIERDLHDGAQARLVALGMNLGLAQELMDKDPEAAAALLSEARTVTTSALGDLRSVVRGIHPPVLADRGLAGAVQALALDMSVPVSVTIELSGRPPAPVESAVYFATSELLANIGKHSAARRATIDVSHDGDGLRVVVSDDGHGGASSEAGSGLAGVARRLAAFDGTMDIVSPAGGPTVVTVEVPCALSSPKISRSSETD